MKKITLILFLIAGFYTTNAQRKNTSAVVGSPCPNFQFNEVRYFSKEKVNLSDFKGKWFILDFWNKHCPSCLERMPGLDSLRQKFIGKVNVLLVGYTGTMYKVDDKSMPSFYDKLKKRINVNLPIALDSLMFHKLAIGPCPYVIVVDPNGIIRAVTTEIKINDMDEFLEGKTPVLDKAFNRNGL